MRDVALALMQIAQAGSQPAPPSFSLVVIALLAAWIAHRHYKVKQYEAETAREVKKRTLDIVDGALGREAAPPERPEGDNETRNAPAPPSMPARRTIAETPNMNRAPDWFPPSQPEPELVGAARK